MTLFSAIALLFMVLDPLGNIPVFASLLNGFEPERRYRIIIRELVIALGILVIFLFTGHTLLAVLGISQSSLGIAGGTILFMIAIKMVFAGSSNIFEEMSDDGPFIVPLAVPLVAGPSSIATVMLLMARDPARWLEWLLALLCAWLAAGIIMLFSQQLCQLLGDRILKAVERLMGMILTAVAVEMLISGIHRAFCS